ncbi:unnamed protein product, partial [Coregonus sp. 'balchen']
EVYVSDKEGDDQDGDGTEQKPFKTSLRALTFAGKEPFPIIYVDSQKGGERWAVISKTQMKNAEDSERREKNLEEARKITIENDSSLPEPKTVKIYQLEPLRGERV